MTSVHSNRRDGPARPSRYGSVLDSGRDRKDTRASFIRPEYLCRVGRDLRYVQAPQRRGPQTPPRRMCFRDGPDRLDHVRREQFSHFVRRPPPVQDLEEKAKRILRAVPCVLGNTEPLASTAVMHGGAPRKRPPPRRPAVVWGTAVVFGTAVAFGTAVPCGIAVQVRATADMSARAQARGDRLEHRCPPDEGVCGGAVPGIHWAPGVVVGSLLGEAVVTDLDGPRRGSVPLVPAGWL